MVANSWLVIAVIYTQQISKTTLPYCAENVCVQADSEGTQLYAVGSRSHVTFIDPRQSSPHCIAGSVRSVDRECGVRSLQFNQQILSIGTGAGHLYFYDMRCNEYLYDNTFSKPCALTASQGWLVSQLAELHQYPSSKFCFLETRSNVSRCFQWSTSSFQCSLHSLLQSSQNKDFHCRGPSTSGSLW